MHLIDSLREQHGEILALARGIGETAREPQTAAAGQRLREQLDALGAVLVGHLEVEDTRLYPGLISSKDLVVAGTARRFAAEMGGLANAFHGFDERWRAAERIERELTVFRAELDSVIGALTQRILAEENLLYLIAGPTRSRAG